MLADSFEGFDLDELRRERASGLTTASDKAFTSTSYRYVQTKLAKLGINDIVLPVKGFFQTTLPHINSEFCCALVDCDFRETVSSTVQKLFGPIWLVGGEFYSMITPRRIFKVHDLE